MTPTSPLSAEQAKEKVLQFVRAANPHTLELKFGCKILVHWKRRDEVMIYKDTIETLEPQEGMLRTSGCDCCSTALSNEEYKILGSDMGLQELLIAFMQKDILLLVDTFGSIRNDIHEQLTWMNFSENLHNQPDQFYLDLLPLITND